MAILVVPSEDYNKDDTNRIPQSEFWLVDNKEYIGTVIIRHELDQHLIKVDGHIGYGIRPLRRKNGFGKLILELALAECSKLGIKRIPITCHLDNLATRKIIEYNDGLLDNEISFEDNGNTVRRLRYWIEL
jgi:predicted acetyltransferase